MQQIKKRPAVAERFVLWPLGLEADGPSPIVRGGFQTDTRAGILKISKFYFFREPLHFLQQFPHRGDMYSCFLLVIQSRVFFHFAWMFVAGGGEFIFMFAGGRDIFVPGRATYEPRLPLYRGYPPYPAAACPSQADRHKKIPPRVLLYMKPVPGFPTAAGSYFAKYLFSEPPIHVSSFFCSRFWIFCINSLSASVTASAVISI